MNNHISLSFCSPFSLNSAGLFKTYIPRSFGWDLVADLVLCVCITPTITTNIIIAPEIITKRAMACILWEARGPARLAAALQCTSPHSQPEGCRANSTQCAQVHYLCSMVVSLFQNPCSVKFCSFFPLDN